MADGSARIFVIAGGGLGRKSFRSLQRKGIPFATGIIYEDSQLSCHDDIVGRSEDSVYFVSNQGGGSGNYFVVGICSLLGVGDAFFI